MYSIILTTYKNPEYLKLCVDSILNNSYYKTHQLCIHINGYDQESIDYLNSKNIKYTLSQDNIGIAKAGLICAKHAIYDTLISANDDQYFTKDWDYYLHQWEIELKTKFPDHKQFISYRMCEPFEGSFLPVCNAGTDINNFNVDILTNYIRTYSSHDIQGWLTNTLCPKDIFIKCNPGDFETKICDIAFIMNILNHLNVNNIKFLMVGIKDSFVYHFGSIVTKKLAKQNIQEPNEVSKFENKYGINIDTAFNKVLNLYIDKSIKLIKEYNSTPKIYVVGDSHIHMFEDDKKFTIRTIGGATAHNLIKKDSTTKSNQKLFDIVNSMNKERDSIILVLGEIDCRIHIYYQYKKNNEKYTISELIDKTIYNYGQVMKALDNRNINFYIRGIPPSTRQTNIYNYKWYATPEIHSKIYREFNTKLKEFCNQHKYKYLDVYSKTVDKEGFISKEYMSNNDGVHLNKKILPDIVNQMDFYNRKLPTISTYITAHNSLFYQSTLEQTIRQSLSFSDEIIVVNSEQSSDGTQELLDILHEEYPNIIKVYTFKEDYSKLWNTVTEKKTFALKKCTKDYAILQDDDECIHEKYASYIKQLPQICPETIAFRFNTIHFYRSYNHYQSKHPDWYNRRIYMIKNIPEIKHGRVNNDLDNHIITLPYIHNSSEEILYDTTTIPLDSLPSPKVINTPITSYHYGWCRNDAILLLKKYHQDAQWHGNQYWKTHEFPFKFDNPNNLPKFKGTHPKHMIPLIQQEEKLNSRHIEEFTKSQNKKEVISILHISDCHGNLKILEDACKEDSDIIILTGDFLPNILHDGTNSGSKEDDITHQLNFINRNRVRIINCLKNRPLIYVQGNHDWINLSTLNYNKLYELNNSEIILNSYRLYGFPNTPIMEQWNNYTTDDEFKIIVDKIPFNTDILITHCPPKGILDTTNKTDHQGIQNLYNKIKQTKIRLHLFGHIHEEYNIIKVDNVSYSNASKGHRIINTKK